MPLRINPGGAFFLLTVKLSWSAAGIEKNKSLKWAENQGLNGNILLFLRTRTLIVTMLPIRTPLIPDNQIVTEKGITGYPSPALYNIFQPTNFWRVL